MQLCVVSNDHPDLIALSSSLDDFLNDLVGGQANRAVYLPYNQLFGLDIAVVAYCDSVAVGCACLRRYSDDTAEVKRVFVAMNWRNRGIAKSLLQHLESLAIDAGYTRLILETGAPLVAATALYRGMGYETIANFEPYIGLAESVCMEKILYH